MRGLTFSLLYISHVTPTNALFYNLCVQSFRYLLHVSTLLFLHHQGADTNISLKHTTIKLFTIDILMLWYQKGRFLQVLVKIM